MPPRIVRTPDSSREMPSKPIEMPPGEAPIQIRNTSATDASVGDSRLSATHGLARLVPRLVLRLTPRLARQPLQPPQPLRKPQCVGEYRRIYTRAPSYTFRGLRTEPPTQRTSNARRLSRH